MPWPGSWIVNFRQEVWIPNQFYFLVHHKQWIILNTVYLPQLGHFHSYLQQFCNSLSRVTDYVALEQFLPVSPSSAADSTKLHVNSNNKVILMPQKYFHEIKSFDTWLQAWNLYERLLVSHDFKLYHGLVTYCTRIQECNKKFKWSAVYIYDQRFRAELAADHSLDFSHVNHDLYIMVLNAVAIRSDIVRCHRCKSTNHTVKVCPFLKAQPPTQQKERSQHTRIYEGCYRSRMQYSDYSTTHPQRGKSLHRNTSTHDSQHLCSTSESPSVSRQPSQHLFSASESASVSPKPQGIRTVTSSGCLPGRHSTHMVYAEECSHMGTPSSGAPPESRSIQEGPGTPQ